MSGSPQFSHDPVLVDLVTETLAAGPPGVVVDATVGGGGHSAALLEAAPHLSILGIDQDVDALEAAEARLAPFGDRVTLRHGRFDDLAGIAARAGIDRISGALFDLGVSSPQLDRGDRGFSFRNDGPIDMRMDRARPLTAAQIVNEAPADEIARLLADNADERFADRIAKAIVAARPLATTAELADVVRSAIPAPARRRGGDPARRTFQALRIAVNSELDVIPVALAAAVDSMAPGGRLVVLSYHSGEDRLVKSFMRDAETGGCQCPPRLPCGCGATPTLRLVFRGTRTPGQAELSANPRSEPARLRAAERIAAEVSP